jgi:hypothetical protein
VEVRDCALCMVFNDTAVEVALLILGDGVSSYSSVALL